VRASWMDFPWRAGDQSRQNVCDSKTCCLYCQEILCDRVSWVRTLLDPAIAECGYVKVKELKPYVVRDWLDKQKKWNSSTKHTAIGKLSRAFYWALKEGMITANPIAGMEKPEKRTRGKEVIIPEGLQDVLLLLIWITTFPLEAGRLLCRPGGCRTGSRPIYKDAWDCHLRSGRVRRLFGAVCAGRPDPLRKGNNLVNTTEKAGAPRATDGPTAPAPRVGPCQAKEDEKENELPA
jgi:hypothetical protein